MPDGQPADVSAGLLFAVSDSHRSKLALFGAIWYYLNRYAPATTGAAFLRAACRDGQAMQGI
jgi:hypothetical protein